MVFYRMNVLLYYMCAVIALLLNISIGTFKIENYGFERIDYLLLNWTLGWVGLARCMALAKFQTDDTKSVDDIK